MRATRPISTDATGYIETNRAPNVAEKTHSDPDRKPRTAAAQSSSESMRTPGLRVLMRTFRGDSGPPKLCRALKRAVIAVQKVRYRVGRDPERP